MNTLSSPESTVAAESPRDHHVCPWWVGYLITNPIRKLGENPETILAQYARPGMAAVDIGCGMGFFALPLARLIGDGGRVVCVDIQEKMLSSLRRRARRKGVDHIVETRLATQENLALDDLTGEVDLAIAAHVLHETRYPRRVLGQCYQILRPGGHLLVIEPNGHVTHEDFEASRRLALDIGFSDVRKESLKRSRGLALAKPTGSI
ncbi:MAG: class I SAM-dependent methyltransferase [Acidobacteriota bacterium]